MFNILVCEDDRNIRNLMIKFLKKDGYEVFDSENGAQALDVLDSSHIDLLITDVMMPVKDGIRLSLELREAGYKLPILIITARESIEDKKTGFSSGADDYMVKPIDMDEMLMRVSALLRRSGISSDKKIVIGSTTIDYTDFMIRVNNDVINLPKKEFQLLFKLLSQPNRIFTRTQLMDEIWGFDIESEERTVDVHIKRLREKFADNRDFEVITVRGLGYKAIKIEK
jgi:two-component system OmpR family response regulator